MKGYAAGVRRVLLVAFALNAAVAIAKLVVGWRAGSLAVMGDGVHSSMDAAYSLAALVVLRHAVKPPDADHPFGHAKFETLTAFALAGILIVTAFELARHAVGRMLHPTTPEVGWSLVAVMLATLVVNLAVVAYERRAAKRLGSSVLAADAAQTSGDVFVTLSVLGGLALARFGIPLVDPLLALLVAALIARTSWTVVRDVTPHLTDRVLFDPSDVARIAHSVSGVESVHDIRSRGTRREAYVQMHMVVDTDDVTKAHAIADEVERRIGEQLGAREVFIHVEPEDDDSGPPGTRADPAELAVGDHA